MSVVFRGEPDSTYCCIKCDWYKKPLSTPVTTCPVCDSTVKLTKGRFIIRRNKSLWNVSHEYIGFEPDPIIDDYERTRDACELLEEEHQSDNDISKYERELNE